MQNQINLLYHAKHRSAYLMSTTMCGLLEAVHRSIRPDGGSIIAG